MSFVFRAVPTLITPKAKLDIQYQGHKHQCLSAKHYLLHIKRHSHLVTVVAITTKIVEKKWY
jgi:hypothetical protein